MARWPAWQYRDCMLLVDDFFSASSGSVGKKRCPQWMCSGFNPVCHPQFLVCRFHSTHFCFDDVKNMTANANRVNLNLKWMRDICPCSPLQCFQYPLSRLSCLVYFCVASCATASPKMRALLVLVRFYRMSRNLSENLQCGTKNVERKINNRWEWRKNECIFQRESTERMVNMFLYSGNDSCRVPFAARNHSAYRLLWAEYKNRRWAHICPFGCSAAVNSLKPMRIISCRASHLVCQ